jgi:RNA-directed DNA polymerase
VKRCGNLYDQICAIENVRLAHERARKGKGNYSEVKMINKDPEKYFEQISRMLKEKIFINAPYEVFTRVEKGKSRDIFKLPYYPDRIIHHCVMNILEPLWIKIFIRDTFASMKNRGIHDGSNRLRGFLKDQEGTRYCLKFDVHKFYPSIDHDILKQIVRKSIKCPDTLWLLDVVIDSAPGVPIGNYLSQYFANLYLAYFDHWAKEILGAKYYLRYCDDIVILHEDKTLLHTWRKLIDQYMGNQLNLKIKPNWQIFPVRVRGIDFLGYRFFGPYTLIRKRIAKEFKRKVARIKRYGTKLPCSKIVSTTMSYHGWIKNGNGHNLWRSQVDDKLRGVFAEACSKRGIKNPLRYMGCEAF